MLVRYLALTGGRPATEGRTVEQQVLESNPVLEAFGNAKTVKNNNSSGFDKFVELQFDASGSISGAAIRVPLLEKSRVCEVSDSERNYHCFYLLCAAPSQDIEKYELGDPRSFHYLNQTSFQLEGVSDAEEYLATRRAMDVVGISQEEQDSIFRVVAAILHLGNIEFNKKEEIDSSKPKDEKSLYHLKMAAELLMCDPQGLEHALCKRAMVTREETIIKSLDPEAATTGRDAFAEIIYLHLLDWIVEKINNSIGQDPNSKSRIGILDIYGFENFKHNSFEQFCINITNEKLHQHFDQHVFKMEQEEYKKEEINWSNIESVDNQDKPEGIISLLDEAWMFPRSTHKTFAQNLYTTFKNNKQFSKPKLSQTDFEIAHYAGDVIYQAHLFLEKNKDYIVAEHQDLLNASKCPFVTGLFPRLPENSSKSSKFSSMGTHFKNNLEESKAQDIAKLQASVQALQAQLDEANAMLVKEWEAARKAIEKTPPLIQQTHVLVEDTAKVDLLTKENEELKKLLKSEEERANEAEKKYAESQKIIEEILKRAEEAESKADQLQEFHQRLEEKMSNLESESNVLCHQALVMSSKPASGWYKTPIIQRTPENGHMLNGEVKAVAENQNALIKRIMQDVVFSGGRPVAACIIYKSLLQWRSFEVERTSVFDCIIQTIGSAIETQENIDVLAYWLSNTCTILLLLQGTVKASGAAGITPQGFQTLPSGGLDASQQVEAKYPALLFKQQITAYVEKIYGMIRDNLKKEISPLLGMCIQAPRTSRASLMKGSSRSDASCVAAQALIAHWQSIVNSLSRFLRTLRANNVPPFLVRKIIMQIFSFINVQLFNSFLLRRECCSFSNGEFVKAGLGELEHWCSEATEEYAGAAWDELKHTRQAVGFLVIHEKTNTSLDEITHDLCPALSIQQCYRISTMYWDDKHGTHSVSPDVIANMRILMMEDSNNALSNPLLLDDDSSIPFSVDDISKSMKQIDLSDIELPPLIRDNSAFSILLPHTE